MSDWEAKGSAIHHDGALVAVAITPEWAEHITDKLKTPEPAADPPLATVVGTVLSAPAQRMSLGFSTPATDHWKRGRE